MPWLDGPDGSLANERKEPRPRRWYFAMLPFMYALVFGCGGLFMIATLREVQRVALEDSSSSPQLPSLRL